MKVFLGDMQLKEFLAKDFLIKTSFCTASGAVLTFHQKRENIGNGTGDGVRGVFLLCVMC